MRRWLVGLKRSNYFGPLSCQPGAELVAPFRNRTVFMKFVRLISHAWTCPLLFCAKISFCPLKSKSASPEIVHPAVTVLLLNKLTGPRLVRPFIIHTATFPREVCQRRSFLLSPLKSAMPTTFQPAV